MRENEDYWSELEEEEVVPVVPVSALAPAVPVGAFAADLPISPTQSSSMLTCNEAFSRKFPTVYQGLCKGLIDMRMLMAYEIVVPLKEVVEIKRNVLRSRKHVVNALNDRLKRVLKGKFPDPALAAKLAHKIAGFAWDRVAASVQEAEDERSFLQWLLRFDVNAQTDIRLSVNHCDGDKNTIVTHVEGSCNVRRVKGDFFSLIRLDHLNLHLEATIKALFLNGGHLASMNTDPQMIDFVRTGDNRYARRLMCNY